MQDTDVQLSSAVFVQHAEAVLRLMERLRREMGSAEAMTAAVERYVDGEVHPELSRLARVIALARRQALLQGCLDDDREALHHGNLSHEQNISTGKHYETLRREACEYNHLLRGLIESSGHYFSRDELMSWMVSASMGRARWAKGEVTGAVSEIAMHAALQGLPELRGLRYATVDEDLHGFDFVADWQGNEVTFDAKTGYYAPLTERMHGHKHLEVSVPHEAVHGLRVTRHGLDLLRREVRQGLAQG